MKFIAAVEEGESMDLLVQTLRAMGVAVEGKHNLIGVITGYSFKHTLEELKIPGIQSVYEEKNVGF
jgi:hypothetical protein